MLIAICDDQPQELVCIEFTIAAAVAQQIDELQLATYSSGEDLVKAVEQGIRPCLAVLDIYMEGWSGIETAQRLRKLIPGLPLAFLTTSRDFAVEAFALDALHYLIKPVTVVSAGELIERLFAHIGKQSRCLTLPSSRGGRQFPLGQLQYLLSLDRGVEVHLEAGREWVSCLFRQAAERLAREQDFVQISRGCIVNMNYVLYMGSTDCHMKDGTTLPISRRERTAVQRRYHDFLFCKVDQTKGEAP